MFFLHLLYTINSLNVYRFDKRQVIFLELYITDMSKKLWESYFAAMKNEEWAKALDALNAILKQEPKNSQVHLKVGDIFQKAGDLGSAVAAYRRSAWLLINEGFLQKALAIFKIILRLDPDNDEAINKSKELMLEIEGSRIKPSATEQQFDLRNMIDKGQTVDTRTDLPQEEKALEVETGRETGREADLDAGVGFKGGMEHGAYIDPTGKKEGISEEKSDEVEKTAGSADSFFSGTALDEGLFETTSYPESNEKDELQVQSASEKSEDAAEKTGYVSGVPVFLSSLPIGDAVNLINKIDVQTFLPGQKIIQEGDSGDSVFAIKSGSAKVIAHILGREMELAVLSEGDVFGEVAFLTGRPRTASVIAADNLEVLEFDRPLLENIFERYPDVLKKMQDFYQSHVQDTLKKVKLKIKK